MAAACSGRGDSTSTSDQRHEADGDVVADVVIVGAGAAGMTAGHLLMRHGLDVRILEAAPTHGGRIKTTTDFVDFPVSLGGEWLTAPRDELTAIVDDPSTPITSRLERYDPAASTGYYEAGELSVEPLGDFDYLNFVDSSWLDFFDDHIVAGIADRITFDTEVVEIDHTETPVRLTDAAGDVHRATQVIVTAPLAVLQRGDLRFVPALPSDKQAAVDAADVWSGIKVFIEFSERFWPTFLEFPDSDTRSGQRTYYDAAAHHRSDAHVLGLFAVGSAAVPYQRAGDGLREHVLAELDEIFDGNASRTYVQHVVQNWDDEPFIGQAYLNDYADPWIPQALATPLGDRVFFAGDAYTRHDDWGGVDDAAQSARDAVAQIVS